MDPKHSVIKGLPCMDMAAMLIMWPGSLEETIVPPIPWRLHMKFDFDWPSGNV